MMGSSPVSEPEVRGQADPSKAGTRGQALRVLGDLDPVLVVTVLVSSVVLAIALAYAL